ncbi:MAG: isoprenylcysteine carboxylmethyltransferase family protein [Bacteroidales bacterium]|nr:isoprenylcysteine carboxylmethyltransferase family protein [Bacteroidales bacterium]
MRKLREIAGYTLGGMMFVLLIPTLMWLASGQPDLCAVPVWRMAVAIVPAVFGLSLSVWSIVYMRRKGDGNPMDAFGHEVAPRTKHLMTEGPYRLSRNPMLTGSFIYYAGVCVWLWSWQALLVFVAFVAIMMLQVLSEEKRLRKDFGEKYEAYFRRTGRFGPRSLKK